MAKFLVAQCDALAYREAILALWDECLPGTPHERFDWMLASPFGKPVWFIAFDRQNNDIAGAVSMMPRDMVAGGKRLRVGIAGDFMIKGAYRVFGPAMDLQRALTSCASNLGLLFIYTVPNAASKKLAQRAGFGITLNLEYFVKPLLFRHYLKRYLGSVVVAMVAPIVALVFCALSREPYTYTGKQIVELSTVTDEFDYLWERSVAGTIGITVWRSSDYLRWRYLNNPLSQFRFLVCRSRRDGDMKGYVVFTVVGSKLEIFDIFCEGSASVNALLKGLCSFAREERCQSMYVRVAEATPYRSTLRCFGFLNAKTEASVMLTEGAEAVVKGWAFSEGDRNI